MTNPMVLTGRFPPGTGDWIELPLEVPEGIGELHVSYSYDRPEPPPGDTGNACDIGIFDPERFRGYSGGARSEFRIGRPEDTTPGYVAGPIPAGQWRILLAPYTIAPPGLEYRVEVRATPGPAAPPRVQAYAPASAVGRGRDWYRGDLHTHTVHSDGKREPSELLSAARAAGLDFVVSTEHNTATAHGVFGHHLEPDGRDELLLVNGEEVTTRNGHLVAAGLPAGAWIDWRFRAGDDRASAALTEIRSLGGLAIAAHPHAPCLGCQWKFGYDGVDAIEVWNGPWTLDDEVSLQQWNSMLATTGWRPAVGASDSHTPDDPVGLAQTVVLADDLSWDAIAPAIRAGHSYVTGSSEVTLACSASAGDRAVGFGERLPVSGETIVVCTATVTGAGPAVVRFVSDEGWMAHRPIPASVDEPRSVSWTTSPAVSAYVRVEVREAPADPTAPGIEPMIAFGNPIFLGE